MRKDGDFTQVGKKTFSNGNFVEYLLSPDEIKNSELVDFKGKNW